MGRPLNKKFFGINKMGTTFKVQFFNGTASVPGFIVKQIGSKRFKCEDTSGKTAIFKLVNKAATALLAGEMSITAKLDDGTVVHVLKISSRLFTAGDGRRYPWSFSASTTDNAAQVEEAGTSPIEMTPSTGATNLEGDIEV
jgi:hypothetical protein